MGTELGRCNIYETVKNAEIKQLISEGLVSNKKYKEAKDKFKKPLLIFVEDEQNKVSSFEFVDSQSTHEHKSIIVQDCMNDLIAAAGLKSESEIQRATHTKEYE